MVAASIRLLLVGGSLAGGAVCAWLATLAWHRRDVPTARPFGALVIAAGLWSVGYAGALLAEDAGTIATLLAETDAAAALIGPLWLAFALAYADLGRYRRPAVYALAAVVPITYAGLVLTAPLHGVIDLTVEFRTLGGVTVPVLVRTLPFWMNFVVSYFLVFVGYVVLVQFLLSAREAYRRQTALVIAGSLVPLISNALFVLGIGHRTGLDPTPLAFAVGGAIVAWALFEYDFLSVPPLASDYLVDELPDPVIVLDDSERIVDHNQAAVDVFGDDSLLGQSISAVAPELIERLDSGELFAVSAPTEPDGRRLFDPRRSAITDRHGGRSGEIIILRDVTVQQRRLDRVEALQAATERLIEARIDDEVAEIAVSFVERVLGQEVAVVFLAEDDQLRPAAISSSIEEASDSRPPDLTADASPLLAQFESAESGVLRDPDWEWPPFETVGSPERALVLSLGEHGVLCIASREGGEYSEEDRQFATILAGATETALDRVTREQELRENRRVVRQRTEQLEFLNGVLRHNIRNSIQVIDSNAQLLEGKLEDGTPNRERIDRIRERSADLSTLTGKIRSITDTLTTDGDRVWPVDLDPTLSVAVDRVHEDHDVSVDVTVESDHAVLANGLLADVLEAVVRNAAEHNGEEGVRIEINVQPVGEWLQVRIADDGPGVSDHLKESLFERNVSVSQTAHGFGLYFVAVMMDLYGGDVWFEDNEPTGAIAVLEFQRPPTED